MSESLYHRQLLQYIVSEITAQKAFGHEYTAMVDDDRSGQNQKPRAISGFVPDVYAISRDAKFIIIGEAKTANDLETRHSRNQLTAFIRYCNQQASVLLLAVPWTHMACASSLLRSIIRQTDSSRARYRILSDVLADNVSKDLRL